MPSGKELEVHLANLPETSHANVAFLLQRILQLTLYSKGAVCNIDK